MTSQAELEALIAALEQLLDVQERTRARAGGALGEAGAVGETLGEGASFRFTVPPAAAIQSAGGVS